MQTNTQHIAQYAQSKSLNFAAVLESYYGSGNDTLQGTDLISVEDLSAVLETLDKDAEGYEVILNEEHNAIFLKHVEEKIVHTVYVLIATEDEEFAAAHAYADEVVRGHVSI